MKYLLSYLLLANGLSFAFAQDYAYYVSDHHEGVDLYKVKLDYGIFEISETYTFSDSVASPAYPRSYGRMSEVFSVPHLSPFAPKKQSGLAIPFQGFYEINLLDSVEFNHQWHVIECYFSDDQFVGGRQNHIQMRITVQGLGVIYSYTNFSGDQSLLMLNNSDSAKQELLTLVYQKLASMNQWMDWIKCAQLATTYRYSNCLADLTKRWMEHRADLGLVENNITYVGNSVHFSAKLVNRSTNRYFISENCHVGPARFTFLLNNQEYNQPLMDYYGTSFHLPRKEYRLEPGDTISYSYDFKTDPSRHIKSYNGFQFTSHGSLFNWLFRDSIICDGKEYQLFHYHEVLPFDE